MVTNTGKQFAQADLTGIPHCMTKARDRKEGARLIEHQQMMHRLNLTFYLVLRVNDQTNYRAGFDFWGESGILNVKVIEGKVDDLKPRVTHKFDPIRIFNWGDDTLKEIYERETRKAYDAIGEVNRWLADFIIQQEKLN